MSVQTPEKHWWDVPLDKDEKTWVTVALIWCLLITAIMPLWHIVGDQNPTSEYYRVTPEQFNRQTDKFIDKYQVGDEEGIPVVAPPPNADVFMRGMQFMWEPILKLEKGKTYRLHVSAVDVNHGFSVQPININFQAVPGYDQVLTITPTTSGEFTIVCNEFCGIGHHIMTGKIYVEQGGA